MKDWTKFLKEQEETDLKKLIEEENLNEEETRRFIDNSFREGQVKTTGTDIDKILPPMRLFGGGNKTARKQTIIEKILKFFEKYFGLNLKPDTDDDIEYTVKEEDDDYLMVAEDDEDYNVDE